MRLVALVGALAACDRSVLLGSDEALQVASDVPEADVEDLDGPLVHPPDRLDAAPDAAVEPPTDQPAGDLAEDVPTRFDGSADRADVPLDLVDEGEGIAVDAAPEAAVEVGVDVGPDAPRPVRVGPTVALALGGRHGCATSSDGALWCWGANDHGQLGDGTTAPRSRPTPLGLRNVGALVAGNEHTCAVVSGRAWCWGHGGGGRLLRAGDADATTPFDTGVEVAQIVAGDAHTCVLRAGGSVACWGADDRGQRGGAAAGATIGLPRAAVSLAAGGAFTCAVLADGAVWCWGDNRAGQLGRGALSEREAPGAVVGLAGASRVAVGAGHACATTAGGVWCWGDRADGQLGDGVGAPRPRAARVDAWSVAAGVTCGAAFTCERSSNEVRCAGRNDRGQLGDGTTTSRGAPVVTLGFPRTILTLLALGARHGCAETGDRETWCWGDGSDGQLGSGVVGVATTRTQVVW